jgi:UDPglucose 6-dehydrogenase
VRIAVIGTGYVGLVTGVVLADLGNSVLCIDKDEAKVEKLRQGNSPIYEPGIEEMLSRTLSSGRLVIGTSIEEAARTCDIIFIAVGTPPAEDGTPDMSAVKAVAKEIGRHLDHKVIVVNKSTVPVGSGDLVARIIEEQGADPSLFDVLSNPEFLREGSAISDTLHPDRIVIGAKNREAAERLAAIYQPLESEILITDLESAELIKYGANSFLAAKISFINAMSRICELAGANIADVSKGIGMDKRIGPQFLSAGLGWGGSCFPKDVQGLVKVSEKLGYNFALLKEVEAINTDQTLHFVDRMRKALHGFAGKKVGLLGLAFKPNTDDIRDAKSLVIIEELLKEGASVVAYDPVAEEHVRCIFPDIIYVKNAKEVAEGCDCLVLVTEWNEFRQADLKELASGMRRALLFDGRRVYSRVQAEAAGFEYHVVGS